MTITHTLARTFSIAGTAEYPTTISELDDHEGVVLEAEDGTPTAVWLSTKKRYAISWDSPRPEVVERMRTKFKARANFTFVDPRGVSMTAMIPPGKFSYGAKYDPASGTAAGTTYTLSIEVWEA